ncbi:HEAT repeat-containing protein 5B [Senna tora]|uniref:HEAT repeat-containing protein 5B n=1 Tax=Senna tora TaxID=362788 RepID=A0A834WKA0_9FABA|nr:HEAT repeat-containing protein 5B [Senna tora]
MEKGETSHLPPVNLQQPPIHSLLLHTATVKPKRDEQKQPLNGKDSGEPPTSETTGNGTDGDDPDGEVPQVRWRQTHQWRPREDTVETLTITANLASCHVRIEAALTIRALAEVDPTCVGGLTSYGVTTLTALRENVSFEKGSSLQFDLDSLHGQATVLAALVTISPKLPLGYPARLPRSVLEVSKRMLTERSRNPVAAVVEKEAGWLLLSSLLSSLTKEV